jgi:hypothetical protein
MISLIANMYCSSIVIGQTMRISNITGAFYKNASGTILTKTNNSNDNYGTKISIPFLHATGVKPENSNVSHSTIIGGIPHWWQYSAGNHLVP